MKDYKRLTDRDECNMCDAVMCAKYCKDCDAQKTLRVLQELEDKIETGELCDREEVRKETAKEILEAVFQIMVENFFDSAGKQTYVTAKKILRDICPVKVKNACKNVAEKYGIELFGKTEQVENFDKLEDEE